MKKMWVTNVSFLKVVMLMLLISYNKSIMAEDVNLVKNGDFEMIGKDGRPGGWNYYDPHKCEKAGIFQVSTASHSGKHCVYQKTKNYDRSNPANNGGWNCGVVFEPNTTYKLSAWIKVVAEEEKQMVYHLYVGGSASINGEKTWWTVPAENGMRTTFAEGHDWVYFEGTFTTPVFDEPVGLSVSPVLVFNTAEVWIDDVKLVKVEGQQTGQKREVKYESNKK